MTGSGAPPLNQDNHEHTAAHDAAIHIASIAKKKGRRWIQLHQ
jgi:hypothetical protein